MANQKISQMPERTVLTGNEMIPFADGGANGRIKSSLLEGQSAYELAVEAGYEGTEEELSQALSQLQDTIGRVDDLETVVAENPELFRNSKDLCIGAWTDGDLSPDSTDTYGKTDILKEWDFYLIDCTKNTEDAVVPDGTLKPNNLLRFTDGTFAPTVGITEAQRAQCDAELYLDQAHTQKYCNAFSFDAEAFYNEYGMTQKLYNAEGTEIEHILRPWETVETKYTIVKGNKETLYLIDNVKGDSGNVWKGVTRKKMKWDGKDVSGFPLEPTGISPCPVCTVGGKTRSFFYLYEGETNCKSAAGQNGLCTMFLNGRTYPRVTDMQQVTNMNYARANNADNTLPYPFAEGGYHALNTYITCMEVLYGTKYLHKSDRFGSGISSNDGISSEATWKSNGGVRYKLSSDGTWKYTTWSGQGDIYYSSTQQRTTFSNMLNAENPKEQCMESQMAYSFAVETGVPADTEFEFYGATYWWQPVADADADRMNVRVYKKMAQSFSAFDSTGAEADWDVEVILRMSLYDGMNLSGDIYAYWGGGVEQVGTCDQTETQINNPIALYLETDQTKWLRETAFTANNLGTFDFESAYKKIADVVNLGNGYSAKREGYTPFKTLMGGSISTGECYYAYDSRSWGSTLNQRVRIASRFRGSAHLGFCSARYLHALNSASSAFRPFWRVCPS